MFERFTDPAREVVFNTQRQARSLGHRSIQPGHLLLGLLDGHDGVAVAVLREAGVDAAAARSEIERLTGNAGPLGAGDAEALQAIGIDLDAVRVKIEEAFGPGALEEPPPSRRRRWPFRGAGTADDPGEPGDSRHIPFSPQGRKVLELSVREAVRLGHGYIGTEHLLLGLLREGDDQVAKVLAAAGLTAQGVRARVHEALGEAA
jgi:ATP-dependent Clp protease ATP-binding subunit ClpA